MPDSRGGSLAKVAKKSGGSKGGGDRKPRPASRPNRKEMEGLERIVLLAVDPGMQRIVGILDGIRNTLVAVLAALAITALTYAGVRYVIAGGDPSGVEKAKGAAKSALVGLGLALLAPVIVAVVKGIIGA